MICDLEIEENLFSNTFQTSIAKVQPTVSARIEVEKVELEEVEEEAVVEFDATIVEAEAAIVEWL